MADLTNLAVPAAGTGKHFMLYSGRTRDKRIYVAATEGKLTARETSDGVKYESFEYELFGSTRRYRHEADGSRPGTAKAIKTESMKMLSLMLGSKLITEDDYNTAVADLAKHIT